MPDHTFSNDNNPSTSNSSNSPDHLVSYLSKAGITWKAYQEDISGANCPITGSGKYAPKHLGLIFFQDIVGNPPSTTNQNCISHVRPYTELASDLSNNHMAAYNFITPNLCNDMHDCPVSTGDSWLAKEVPRIMNSQAYKDGGAIFITWDEGGSGNNPIGMIVLSPFAKKNYSSTVEYSHSSLLRTVQEILGVAPLLSDAANGKNLSEFFTVPLAGNIPLTTPNPSNPLPTFVCLGACLTSSPVPTETTTPLGTAAPNPTVTQELPVPTKVTPSITPCKENTVNVQQNKKKRHTNRSGGLLDTFLRFLIDLINLLLKLIGGGQMDLPPSNPCLSS